MDFVRGRVFDAEGQPAIAYYDYDAETLKFAHRDGGSWAIELVDDAGDVGEYASLALGSDGEPVIAYYDYDRYALRVARRTDDDRGRVPLRPSR